MSGDAERKARLSEIASFANREPLSDEELKFLEANFKWNEELLGRVKEDRERPFNDFPDGFIEKCRICGAYRNYCCC